MAMALGSPYTGKACLFGPATEGQASQDSHQPCLGVDVTKAGATQNVVPRLRLCDQASPEMGRDHAVPWQG